MTVPPSEPQPPQHESPLSMLQDLWRELPGLFSDRVELLSLELHRAGLALLQIAALVVAAAILGVTAWLALWGAVAALLTLAGLHWLLSLAIVLALNLGAAWLALVFVRRLLPALRLPATRRSLTINPSTKHMPEAKPTSPLSTPATTRTPPQITSPPPNRHEPPELATATATGQ